MFSVAYDVVWFDPAVERKALEIIKCLTHTEVLARGLEEMRGFRVNAGAPIPHDATGAFKGARGACMIMNFLGSIGLAHAMGAVRANGGEQKIVLAEYCKTIEVLQRNERNEPILVGGMFCSDIMERAEVVGGIAMQDKIEADARVQSIVEDATVVDVLVARIVVRLVKFVASPIQCLAMRGRLWAIACTPIFLCVYPVFALLSAFTKYKMRRERERRWALLAKPFSPYLEAQAAMGALSRGKRG